MAREDRPAAFPYEASDFVPHLPGAVFGIQELFDQRGFRIFLGDIAAPLEELPRKVDGGFRNGETLYPLCAPGGIDVAAFHAPNLLRIRLEERSIELASKSVDEELLEVLLGLDRKDGASHIGETDPNGRPETEIAKGRGGQRDRVGEESSPEIDS